MVELRWRRIVARCAAIAVGIALLRIMMYDVAWTPWSFLLALVLWAVPIFLLALVIDAGGQLLWDEESRTRARNLRLGRSPDDEGIWD
jgi:hypothetical protein